MTMAFEANGRSYRVPDRPVLAICADGWDPAYVDDALVRDLMPRLAAALDTGGTYALARAQVPTFTNPNNVAIVTGVSAARNGIAGNHYLDDAGDEVQVTRSVVSARHHDSRRRGCRRRLGAVRDRQGQAAPAAGERWRPGLQRRARPRADPR
jgi:phosphonoacetate hydrolase